MSRKREQNLQDAYFKAADAYQAALHEASELAGSGDKKFAATLVTVEEAKQKMREAMDALNAYRKPKTSGTH